MASSCKSHRQSPQTIVLHHPWRVYPTQKRGRLSRPQHSFRDWSFNKYPISDEEVAQYVKAYSQPGALRGGCNSYRAAVDEAPPQWQADADRQLSTPFLFLFGTRRVRTAEAMGAGPLADVWRPIFPNGRAKHLGHSGHFLQWKAPEEVNRALLPFLGEGAA